MRWQLPKDGELRRKEKFAWLPVVIDNQKIWLEVYLIEQIYSTGVWRTRRKVDLKSI